MKEQIYLTEREVYDLSTNLITNISKDLNQSIYSKLGGKLSIAWREDLSFNASAKLLNKLSDPPDHKIILNYYLVKELYKDVIHYHEFAENIDFQPTILSLLNSISEMPMLPKCFNKKESINNMFMASLTFIFFHELGHLMQQHGRVRALFAEHLSNDLTIDDCDVANSMQLTGKQAAISHVTELAADFSAITRCIIELIRQFSDDGIGDKKHQNSLFLGMVQLFVSGISSLFYRFRGLESSHLEISPQGTHPLPLLRLELNLPHIFEMLSLPIIKHGLNRKELVALVTRAAYSSACFWLVRDGDRSQGVPENYFLAGILNSEDAKKYIEHIITTRDEIEALIDSYNLDDMPFSKINFTDEIRNLVKT